MEDTPLPPGHTVSPLAAASLEGTETNKPVSSFVAASTQYPLETLEVHPQDSVQRVAASVATIRSVPFSRRRAIIVSLAITLLVLLLTAASMAFILRREASERESQLRVPAQDVVVGDSSVPLAELEGVDEALLVNGDIIARGEVKVVSGDFTNTIETAELANDQVLTLPNASGTFCLDSNNCSFATQTQLATETAQTSELAADLAALQTQLDEIAAAGVSTLNGQAGAVTIQGTANQISVATANGVITLSAPQDLAPASSPTFAGLQLNGDLNVTGTVDLPLNCSGFVNTGKLTTNSSGQIICGDDVGGGGGGAPANANYLVTSLDGTLTNERAFAVNSTNLSATDGGANGSYTLDTVQNIATTSSPTFAGLTLNGNLGLGANSIQGTTATIDFTNFDVSSAGAVTAVGVNAGSGLLQGTGGLTVGGTITLSSLTNGFLEVNGSGVVSVGTINLGADTAGDYIANLGTLTGLTTTGNSGEGSTPTLSVIYGSAASTAVQGNTGITVTAGTNLTGGGSITLGAGGSVTLDVASSPTFAGDVVIQGGDLTVGTATQVANLVLHDGDAETVSLTLPDVSTSYTLTLPTAVGAANQCLKAQNGTGALFWDTCLGGGGGGVTGAGTNNRVAKFTSTGSTIGDSTISDDGTNVSITGDFTLQGGDITVGTTSQLGSLILHDGNGQTATLRGGDSSGNLVFILPTAAGATNQCIKQSGTANQLVFDNCDGGGGGSSATLQQAYNNGNTIATTSARDIAFTLSNDATDSNFVVTIADDSTSTVQIVRANGTGANNPAQLMLLDNLDTNQVIADGLLIQSAGGGITDAIDLSDAELVNALNLGDNNVVGTTTVIDFTNFDVAGNGNTSIGGTLAVTGTVTGGTYNGQTITNTASFTGTLSVAGATTLQSTLAIQGASATIGGAAQQGSLILNDGNGQTATLSVGSALAANTALAIPTAVGASDIFCLQILGNCFGSGTGNTLQAAYDAGNTISTTDNRNIAFTLSDDTVDSDFIVNMLGTGNIFEVQDGGTPIFTVADGGVITIGDVNSSAAERILGAFNDDFSGTGDGTYFQNLATNASTYLQVRPNGIGTTSAVALTGSNTDHHGYLQYVTDTAFSLVSTSDTSNAGVPITLSVKEQSGGVNEVMRLTSTGQVGIGTASPDARLELAGNESQAAWGLNGIQLQASSATYTDTGTAGTRTNTVINSFGQPTIASTNAVTSTNAATVYVQNAPAAGANHTISNAYALWVDDGNARFDGNVGINTTTPAGSLQVVGRDNTSGTGTISSAADVVTGTGTFFTREVTVGTVIIAGGQQRTVIDIASNTSLTTDSAFSPALSGEGFTYRQPIATFTQPGNPDGENTNLLYVDREDGNPAFGLNYNFAWFGGGGAVDPTQWHTFAPAGATVAIGYAGGFGTGFISGNQNGLFLIEPKNTGGSVGVNIGSGTIVTRHQTKTIGFNETPPDSDDTIHIRQTIPLATTVGYRLRAAASQTADLLQVTTSAGGALLNFSAGGNLGIGDATPDAKLDVEASAPTIDIAALNASSATTTTGVDGLQVMFSQGADAAADTNYGINIDASTTGDNSGDIFGAVNTVLTNTSSAGTQYGMFITNADSTGTTEALLQLLSLDTTANVVTDYLHISTTADDTTTDAIDVSDDGLFNAINVGANNIAGTTAVIDFTNFDVSSTGDITTTGNVSVQGNTTIGNASTDTVTFNAEVISHIIPDVDVTYDLGSATNRWRDLYVGPASLHVGTNGDEGTISYNTSTNTFQFSQAISTPTFRSDTATFGVASTTDGVLTLQNAANAFTVSINAPNQTVGSATISLPDTAGVDDEFCLLALNNCGSAGGVTTIGTIDSQTKSANGAVISGTSLILQTADVTFPGLVNTGTQTFAGAKTFNGAVTAAAAGTGLTVSNNASVGGNLAVTGTGTFTGDVAVNGGDLTATGALNVTPSGTLTLGVTGQAAVLQGSTTSITSNGAGNDITLTSADQIILNAASGTLFQNGSGTTVASMSNLGTMELIQNGYTTTGVSQPLILIDGTINKDNAVESFYALHFNSTINVTANPTVFGGDTLFRDSSTRVYNTASTFADDGGVVTFQSVPNVQATGGGASTIGSGSNTGVLGFQSDAFLSVADSSTLTVVNMYGAQLNASSVGTGVTVTNRYGARVGNGAGAGSITNQYGLYVDNLTKGTNDYGIYLGGADTADIFFATDVNHVLKVQDQDTAATAGNSLSVTGANGNTSGAGGNINITSGNGGGTGASNAGTITINNGTVSGAGTATINIGSSNTTALNLGTTTNAVGLSIGGTGANTVAIGNTQTAGSISLGAAMTSGTIQIGGTGAQTGTITFGGGTGAQTVNLGTGSTGIKTVNLGTGTAANVISIGTGQTGGSISMGTAMTTGTISIGGTGAQTGTINLGTGTGAQAINLGTGGTAAKTVTLGSAASSSTTTIQAGASGTLNLSTDGTNRIIVQADGDIAFDPSASSTLFVDAVNNRVGMGTEAPGARLHIQQGVQGATDGFRLQDSDSGRAFEFYYDTGSIAKAIIGGSYQLGHNVAISETGQLAAGTTLTLKSFNDSGSGAIIFDMNGTEMGRFTNAGNLGVGDATPDGRLDVELASTSTTAGTERGISLTVSDTGVVTTGTDTTLGEQISVTRTGATGGTINTTGIDVTVTGDAGGTSTAIGLNVNVSGADTNYAAIFQGGNVGIGLATPGQELEVNGDIRLDLNGTATTNGLCHSSAGTTDEDIVDCSGTPGDIAEWYETETDVEPGDLVATTDNTFSYQEKLYDPLTGQQTGELAMHTNAVLGKTNGQNNRILGVVSTSPYQVFGESVIESGAHNPRPIALAGRVPVKVTLENGPIAIGDPLAASSTPGHAMKATEPGMIIGYALESFDTSPTGKIDVFVSVGYFAPSVNDSLQQGNDDSIQNGGPAQLSALNVSGPTTLTSLTVTGDATIQGELTVATLHVIGQILVDGHIVTGGNVPTSTVPAGQSIATVIDGTDTAGTLTLTSDANSHSGVLVAVTFAKPFNETPRIALTPINADAVNMKVYLQKTATGFALVTDDNPIPGKTYQYDYIVIE